MAVTKPENKFFMTGFRHGFRQAFPRYTPFPHPFFQTIMVSLACSRLVKKLASSAVTLVFVPSKLISVQRVRAGLQVQRIHSDSFGSQTITIGLPENSFRAHNCEKPSLDVQMTKHELLTMYREMQTVRRMEMAAEELYKAELVRGYCHLAIGQVSLSRWLKNILELHRTHSLPTTTGSGLDRSRTRD
jgi:hypothetical protein